MTEIESFFQVYRDVPKATGFTIALLYGEGLPIVSLYVTLSTLDHLYVVLHTRRNDKVRNDKIFASCLKYMIPYETCGEITRHIRIHESIYGYVPVTIYTPYELLYSTPSEDLNPSYLMECDDIASILGLVERKLNGN